MQDIKRGVGFGVEFESKDTHIEKELVRMRTGFKLSITEGTRKRTEVLLIECLFEAEYQLQPGYQPTEDEVKAFQSANAIFNCWPFFREYASNTVSRMGFPVPPIPFLRMIPGRRSQKDLNSATELPHDRQRSIRSKAHAK